jgi:hypothetical protein
MTIDSYRRQSSASRRPRVASRRFIRSVGLVTVLGIPSIRGSLVARVRVVRAPDRVASRRIARTSPKGTPSPNGSRVVMIERFDRSCRRLSDLK